ncbi:MAG TPA: efflux RND transporter permease subunit, partial [Candidatus Limnocylindria bacterium]|nr:efflux RND transporter permease subunit [Candidatus Limnocylindria bacterium]
AAAIQKALQPIVANLPEGYRIETGGPIEESAKANAALAKIFPIMVALMLAIIMVQVRSFPAMSMVMLTAPLGLVGAVPALLLFHQPFGFNAILALIGLAGILMRNTLILIGQIRTNEEHGLDPYHAVIEATVQRARPVILTALAAILAFVPLTHSVFWGALAYTLIGGTAVGTVLTLVFLPALYAIWFRVKPAVTASEGADQPIQDVPPEPGVPAPDATAWAFRADWWRPASGITQPVPQAAIPQHAAE